MRMFYRFFHLDPSKRNSLQARPLPCSPFQWKTPTKFLRGNCPDSLLPPGEQQAVVEEVQVDRLAGQLQLGGGRGRQWGQLHQLPVPHQPAGLRDQREDLGGCRRPGGQVRPEAEGPERRLGMGRGGRR